MITDQNGNRVTRGIRRDITAHGMQGWGVTVWFGGMNGFATDCRRIVFTTRAQARAADISDYPQMAGWLGYAAADQSE